MSRTTLFITVILTAFVAALPAQAGCPPYCPCSPCCIWDADTPIHAVPFPALDPDHPEAGGYKRVCKQDANPPGSENWPASRWADYLGLSVRDISDFDRMLCCFRYVEDPCDLPSCELVQDCYDDLRVENTRPFVVLWSGSVDLTTIGTYELIATVLEWPDSLEPCTCMPGVQETLDLCFVVEVYTGVWKLHDERVGGVLTPKFNVQYDPNRANHIPYYDYNIAMGAGSGWAFTLLSNLTQSGEYRGYVNNGDLQVSTIRSSSWTKWYRWEDGNGNPSDCPIPRTLFKYKVALRATASASGDSNAVYGVARASSGAAASVTVSPWGDVAQEPEGLHSVDINVVGSAQTEPPHYTWSISTSGGSQIGRDSGSSPKYNAEGARRITATGALLPKTDGGQWTGTVGVTVGGAAYSQSSLGNHATSARAEAEVAVTEFELEIAEQR